MGTEIGLAAVKMLGNDHRRAAMEIEQATDAYVALLNADTGNAEDAKRLAAAARTLGKRAGDVAADVKAVADAKAMVARIESFAGCEVVCSQLNALTLQNYVLAQAEAERIDRQHRKLENIALVAFERQREFNGAIKLLTELKALNPVLAPLTIPSRTLAQKPGVAPEQILPSFAKWLTERISVKADPLESSASLFPTPK